MVVGLDKAATNWGVKVLRYEIKDLTHRRDPPRDAGAGHRRARARGGRDLRAQAAENRSTSPPARAGGDPLSEGARARSIPRRGPGRGDPVGAEAMQNHPPDSRSDPARRAE
jgi:hypothetical protein